MTLSPTLRQRISDAFGDEDLRALAFDSFRLAYDQFAAGMTRGQLIQVLLESCARRGEGERLLEVLERLRPGLIGTDAPSLLAQLAPPASAEPAPASSGVTISNAAPNQGAQGTFSGPVTINVRREPNDT